MAFTVAVLYLVFKSSDIVKIFLDNLILLVYLNNNHEIYLHNVFEVALENDKNI